MSLLCAIAYISTSSKVLVEAEIEALLASARNFNSEVNVTGALLLNDRTFFQYFEGPVESVEKVYERIKGSQLHTGIIELLNQKVQKRIFSSWFMGFAESPRSKVLSFEQLLWNQEIAARKQESNPSTELGFVLDYCNNVRGRLNG